MTQYYKPTSKNNIILLVGISTLFVFMVLLMPHINSYINTHELQYDLFGFIWSFLILLMAFFASFIYGLLSKDQIKSALLGFVLSSVYSIATFATFDEVDPFMPWDSITRFLHFCGPSLLMILLITLSGWFAAKNEDDKKKRRINNAVALICVILALLSRIIFAILFYLAASFS
ncbi:hypothetical protein [Methanolapillus millepedarum]|uniref:Uncharacterized protein n=1 Tax=Methanolapillus millepedarum TaxID=3028296 RepID=A0AA96VGC4_9EURY|nr:hypothetical protein MsAc7_16290 [Methanosarcinaceae archaeon Ac7]